MINKKKDVKDIKDVIVNVKDIKENFCYVLYSNQSVRGLYNYDSFYKIDYSSFFQKYPSYTKFKLKWFLGSRNKTNNSGDNMGLLFIDFSTQINQQDSSLNNNIHNMGLIKINVKITNSVSYYWLSNQNETEEITISKPTSNVIRVYFRTCDNRFYFNGSNEEENFNPIIELPDFYIKLEFEPL